MPIKNKQLIFWFNKLTHKDVPFVGGKNASLGEMYQHLIKKGINIPNGFASSSYAYFYFLKSKGIWDRIEKIVKTHNLNDVAQLQTAGKKIRSLILKTNLPEDLEKEIIIAYKKLSKHYKEKNTDVAVRSSATAEDLPSIAADEMVLVKMGDKIKYLEVEKVFDLQQQVENQGQLFVPSLNNEGKIGWHKAIEVYKHPAHNKKLYKITTRSGREITITKDHSLLTLDSETLNIKICSIDDVNSSTRVPVIKHLPLAEKKPTFLDVEKIIESRPTIVDNKRVKIKQKNTLNQQYGLPAKMSINNDFAYFLGIYLAEGSIYEKQNAIDIYCDSQEVLKRVRKFYKSINSYNPNKIKSKRKVRVANAVLAALLHDISGKPLPFSGKGRSARTKHVPDFMFVQSEKIIGQFIRGLFDGDGWIEQSGIYYCSLSKKLIGGISELLSMLQIKHYLTKNCTNISIPTSEAKKFEQLVGFEEQGKKQKLNALINNYQTRTKHQDFIETFPPGKKITELLEAKLKPRPQLQKIKVFLCPKCGTELRKNGSYSIYQNTMVKISRYYCKNCHFSPSERSNLNLPSQFTHRYLYYDKLGRFQKNTIPWNKGNRKQRLTYGAGYLKKLAEEINSQELQKITDADVMWDRIVKIEPIKYSGFVYDFVVPKTQNFAAGIGSVITHNTASFAGQQETYLNIKGEKELLLAFKKCIASLFTDRAISYREQKGFDHLEIALSVGVQKMVRSDIGSSGVMFTLDTETGFKNIVLINSIWGIGEMIVQGKITPDEFLVFKPTLTLPKGRQKYQPIIVKNLGRKTKKFVYGKKGGLKEVIVSPGKQLQFSLNDKDILTLAKWGVIIEEHYSKIWNKWMPQDIEWAKDGKTGELFIVQSRPETIHAVKKEAIYEKYEVDTKKEPIVKGIAIGDKIGQGKANIIPSVKNMRRFKQGDVLVTNMTDPDWVVIMKMASAIVTNEGGKSCHSAIVSRELGIPCIVGTRNATKIIKNGQYITVDCTQGLNGKVFEGKVPYKVEKINLKKVPKLKTKISVNIGAPELAFKTSFLPVDGVGLAREEFIIAQKIQVHPLALYHYKKLKKQSAKNKELKPLIKKIEEITVEHKDKKEFFIKELAEGIAQIAAAFWPNEVIVRFSDFKTNEYAQLVGGELYEPKEENPMIGWRGASRYYDPAFAPAFRMECMAIKRVREVFGLKNVTVMIPFCRTTEEGEKVLKIMSKHGLKREKGAQGLKAYVMCEIPSNILLADKFLDIFDGMSIGSNDLTQLTMGLDRDNATLVHIADERNPAVLEQLKTVIRKCRQRKKYVGICGDAPSTFIDFARFLEKEKIDALSLSPDAVIKTLLQINKK